MKSLKKLSIFMCFCVIFLSFSGCGVSSDNTSKKTLPKKISISYVKAPLNVPSIVEKKNKLFEKEFSKDGIGISYPEITEGSKMTEAVAAGSLDFCNAIGATSVILAAANGVDIKIIGVYSRAPKAFTIMTKDPAIKSIKDLKGKKIVGPKGTILHQLLLGALEKESLKVSDVQFINMGIPDGVAALLSNKADAALVAGSAVLNAEKSGAHIITDGEGILDATIVIGASSDMLKKYPNIAKRYLKVHNESLDFMKKNKDKTYELAAEETKLSIDQVKQMYDLYDFNPQITNKDIDDLKATEDFLKKNNMLTKDIDVKSLIVNLK